MLGHKTHRPLKAGRRGRRKEAWEGGCEERREGGRVDGREGGKKKRIPTDTQEPKGTEGEQEMTVGKRAVESDSTPLGLGGVWTLFTSIGLRVKVKMLITSSSTTTIL